MNGEGIEKVDVTKLKNEFYNWDQLTKEKKRTLTRQLLDEIEDAYFFDRIVNTPIDELSIIPAVQEAGMMALNDMERFITDYNRHLLSIPISFRKKCFKDRG